MRVAAVSDRESGAVAPQLARVFQPGETVLWTGRRQRRTEVIWVAVVAVLWLGALGFLIARRDTTAIVIFGIATALLIVTLRTLVSRDVAYGLTSQRAVIVRGRFRPQVRSIPLQWLTDFQLTERQGGVGTIALDPLRRWTPPRGAAPEFEQIMDARRVHTLMQRAQNKLLGV
jgi:uncharacterized MnhB-related membrane protein